MKIICALSTCSNLKLEQNKIYNSTQEKISLKYYLHLKELHQYILDKASTNPLIEYNSVPLRLDY